MVFDPLTALSLASNIIQLVDFTSRVVAKCRHIYADGALPEHYELHIVTEDVKRTSTKLKQRPPPRWPLKLDKDYLKVETDQERKDREEDVAWQEREEEWAFNGLSSTCIKIADELLARLSKHSVPDGIPRTKWKSFREALETVWKKKDLDELAARLAEIRNQMAFHILAKFKTMFDLSVLQQSYRFDWLDCQTQRMIQNLEDNQGIFSDELRVQNSSIANLFQEARNHFTEQQTKTRNAILKAIDKASQSRRHNAASNRQGFGVASWEYQSPQDDDQYSLADSDFGQDADDQHEKSDQEVREEQRMRSEAQFKQAILQSLRFPSMSSRFLEIAPAHAKTFDWVFRGPRSEESLWSNFGEWLRNGSGIYWINGKAGSGKSTLMRYICQDPRTLDFLSSWGGQPGKPTIVGFFFCNIGTPEQSSQLGLLRSLLHEILSRKPECIPSVFPERWEVFEEMETLDPESSEFRDLITEEKEFRETMPKLMLAFQKLLRQEIGPVCLFIDGLDEYNGDPDDTINLFKTIVSPKVKICLSSRPWLPFQDAFKGCQQMKLEDLTRPDIQAYVDDTLSQNSRMKAMYLSEPVQLPKLVQEIVNKAAGVFLWVNLVVASLLRGASNHDHISDLQRRVLEIPSELESLFTYMIRLIEPVYLEQGLQIFRIMLRSQEVSALLDEEEDYLQVEGLCAIDLSFALEMDTTRILQTPVTALNDEDVFRRAGPGGDVECRLKVRCAGLLEIPTPCLEDTLPGSRMSRRIGNTKVRWLHRTVKDFLETEGAQELLLKSSRKSDFSPSLPLLRASIMRLKTWLANTPAEDGIHPLPGLVARAMILAHQVECELDRAEVELLDELDATVRYHWQPDAGDELSPTSTGHWADDMLYRHLRMPGEWNDNFLTLAIQYDLPLYLSQKIRKMKVDLSAKPGRPYLDYIVWSDQVSTGASKSISAKSLGMKRDVLALLLHQKCDPNQLFDGKTPWQKVQYKVCNHIVELGSVWIEVMRLFIRHGADLRAFDADGDSYEVRKIVETVFSHRFRDESEKLLALLPPPMSRSRTQSNRTSASKAMTWFKKTVLFNRASTI
ncbi:hypothetical protein ACEPPN_018814 [Leptodophora sp. 'Broadleaf-Isolate-01']